MKIGIISDIHSNIYALEAVFKYFKNNNIKSVICLGDIIGIGPYPEKCIEFFMKNKEMILAFVKGNHEKYLIDGIKKHNHKDAKPMTDEELSVHYWNLSKINEKEKSFISSFNKEECIQIENKKVVVTHYPLDEKNKDTEIMFNYEKKKII